MSTMFDPIIYSGIILSSMQYLLHHIPWTCIFLLTRYIGINLYIITNREVINRVQSRVKYTTEIGDNEKKSGYSIGYWYYMKIMTRQVNEETRGSIWMIASEASFTHLTQDRRELVTISNKAPKILQIFDRGGNFSHPWYQKRKIYGSWTAQSTQHSIIKCTQKLLTRKEHPHAVIYLHGPPGTGKSMIAILLTLEINGNYCNTLKPWQPGDTIANLWNEAEPTAEKPLVIVFDEFDIALLQIHHGITSDRVNPIAVQDKPGWNRMLDDFDIGMYPHTVLVLTSNKGPDFINDLDPSYIRKNRVNEIFHLNEVIN
jgi:hypothetical protein